MITTQDEGMGLIEIKPFHKWFVGINALRRQAFSLNDLQLRIDAMDGIGAVPRHHPPPGHLVGIGPLQNASDDKPAERRVAGLAHIAVGRRPPRRNEPDDGEHSVAGGQLRAAAMRGLAGATSTWALLGTTR